jgi:methylmalonyl-CoA/ethylmalonyl-CoA epimerase
MKEPALTETMQIGIVVRDLDATIRRYEDHFGIGPWQVHQFKPGDIKEWREHGQPAKPSTASWAASSRASRSRTSAPSVILE